MCDTVSINIVHMKIAAASADLATSVLLKFSGNLKHDKYTRHIKQLPIRSFPQKTEMGRRKTGS